MAVAIDDVRIHFAVMGDKQMDFAPPQIVDLRCFCSPAALLH
jgi:hypothetical protein